MRSTQRNEGLSTVLGRALTILSCYAPTDGALTLAELTRRTGLAKGTVHRLLAQLAERRIVERTPNGYVLGIRLFELGQMAHRQRGLRDAALPFLNDLLEATRETVHLAVLDGLEVVYVEKLQAKSGPELPSRVGGRMPLHCTGVGKTLLAFSPPELLQSVVARGLERRTPHTIVSPTLLFDQLSAIREDGVAYEHEESIQGVACVACPVFGVDRTCCAAISISGWTSHINVNRVAPAVRASALALSRQVSAPYVHDRPGSALTENGQGRF